MSKREKEASNTFRPSDRSLTEYEKEQIALRKNLERLRAERAAREAAIERRLEIGILQRWAGSSLSWSVPPYGSIRRSFTRMTLAFSN